MRDGWTGYANAAMKMAIMKNQSVSFFVSKVTRSFFVKWHFYPCLWSFLFCMGQPNRLSLDWLDLFQWVVACIEAWLPKCRCETNVGSQASNPLLQSFSSPSNARSRLLPFYSQTHYPIPRKRQNTMFITAAHQARLPEKRLGDWSVMGLKREPV